MNNTSITTTTTTTHMEMNRHEVPVSGEQIEVISMEDDLVVVSSVMIMVIIMLMIMISMRIKGTV